MRQYQMADCQRGLALSLQKTLEGRKRPVHAVAFSLDGGTLAAASYDSQVGLFELFEGSDVNSVMFKEVSVLVSEEDWEIRVFDWFGGDAKTINGNSVVLRLDVGAVRMLFPGDLNVTSERFLLCEVG